MKKNSVKRYAIEALLIVFSVLLALFLNKAFENRKTNRQIRVARESIVRELQQNKEIAEKLIEHHQSIKDRISQIRQGKNDSLYNRIRQDDRFNLGHITDGKSLAQDVLSATSWETARSTTIISEFAYEEVESLTKVYFLQHVLWNKSLDNIVNLLFDPATHELQNLDKTLLQFELRFQEVIGQEYLLLQLYDQALSRIKK